MSQPNDLVSLTEAAYIHGKTEYTLRDWIRKGLPSYGTRPIQVSKAELIQWLANRAGIGDHIKTEG